MDTNIWRIETESKQPPVKVISSTQYDSSPQYSPDGSRVAFRSNRSGSNEIWVSDSNGRIPVQLTKYGGPLTGTPRWSPDGMNIAFDTRPDGQADIYVVSSIGGTAAAGDQVGGRRCSALLVGGWRLDLFRIEPDRRVAGLARAEFGGRRGGAGYTEWRFAAFESPDGRYLYYAKGRSASGLWRKQLPAGTEELVLPQLKPGYWGYWAVVENGIYFADQTGRLQRFGRHLLLRFRHAEDTAGVARGQAVRGRRLGICGLARPSAISCIRRWIRAAAIFM